MQPSPSIAVLPFRNMSSDPDNEYFCDGITEEIINALAKIDGLKVTSRTSSFHFKDKDIPIPEIAETLGVSTILEGSVRRAGEVVRITAQLIQAEEDFHFWSERWDRNLEHIFAVQDEISLLIADKIREQVGHFEVETPSLETPRPELDVYESYLRAKFHKNKWNPEDIQQAEEYFQQSLAMDPEYVPSLVGLADVYSFKAMTGLLPFQTGWQQCNELIEKALQLDPKNPEAYYQKGHSAFFTECNFAQAFAHGEKAIRLKPNYVDAQQFMSFLHILAGKETLAKKHLDIALEIDPLSQETLFFKAYFHYMTRNFPEAYQQLNSCLAVNPKNIPAHAVMTLCLLKMGQYEDVLAYFDDLPVELPQGEKTGALALAYALKNDKENTARYRKQLEEEAQTPDGFTSASFLFVLDAVTGETEKAFAWVKAGLENRSTLLMLRYPDPLVDALRSDPRYEQHQQQIYTFPAQIPSKGKKALLNDATADQYRTLLLEHLDQNTPFLDPELSLRSLAAQIDIHPNQLSWLLNATLGKSFSQFINAYRVAHFKRLAKDPQNANLTLIGLAYESGFNSKTVFNTWFKKETGITPKQFLQGQ